MVLISQQQSGNLISIGKIVQVRKVWQRYGYGKIKTNQF